MWIRRPEAAENSFYDEHFKHFSSSFKHRQSLDTDLFHLDGPDPLPDCRVGE